MIKYIPCITLPPLFDVTSIKWNWTRTLIDRSKAWGGPIEEPFHPLKLHIQSMVYQKGACTFVFVYIGQFSLFFIFFFALSGFVIPLDGGTSQVQILKTRNHIFLSVRECRCGVEGCRTLRGRNSRHTVLLQVLSCQTY